MNLYKIEYPTMQVTFKGQTLDVLPPKKSVLGELLKDTTESEFIKLCAICLSNNKQNYSFSADDLSKQNANTFYESFVYFINQLQAMPELKIPYCPEQSDDIKYNIDTFSEKLVAEYSGLSFFEVEELNIVDFWLLLRNAVIYNRMQSEDGRKYLDKCWCMEQTKPDRKRLLERFGGGE